MNIKPILVRLQTTMNRDDLIEQMVLLPGRKAPVSHTTESAKSHTFVVGYSGSPNSHAALDLTMLIAHQTRLATNKQVTVQIVHVIDANQSDECPDVFSSYSMNRKPKKYLSASSSLSTQPVLAVATAEPRDIKTPVSQANSIEQADRILWQARYLVQEWQDSFVAHLRFGCLATELEKVVKLEAADALFLGCNSARHPLVKKLGSNFPCSVLGIPSYLDS